VFAAGRSVHVLARTSATEAACPGCGVMSRRVHSRYQRKLADTASGGQEVLIHLDARRFICGNGACKKATFAEQVPGLTTRYGRRTCGLQVVLQAVGLALGGRAGARLTGRLACSASRSTLLQLIRAAPNPRSSSWNTARYSLPPKFFSGAVSGRPGPRVPRRGRPSFNAKFSSSTGENGTLNSTEALSPAGDRNTRAR